MMEDYEIGTIRCDVNDTSWRGRCRIEALSLHQNSHRQTCDAKDKRNVINTSFLYSFRLTIIGKNSKIKYISAKGSCQPLTLNILPQSVHNPSSTYKACDEETQYLQVEGKRTHGRRNSSCNKIGKPFITPEELRWAYRKTTEENNQSPRIY